LKISVVIPAYNEEKNITPVLEELLEADYVHEVIVVDDGSKDGTAALVGQYPRIRLVQHPYNIGNGAAIKTGIRSASGDVIVLMDGDGQHPPAEIPGLLAHIGPYDMVVGARTATTQATLGRRIANGIFNFYATYIVSRRVEDLTSGFRALKSPIAKNFTYLLPNGFSYPTTLTIAFFRAGYTVKYSTFAAGQRLDKSHIKPLRDGARFLLTLTRLAVLFVPLKIFIPISLFLTLTGGGYVISQLLLFRRFSGFGGLVTTIGIFIFVLGLISEQIALLRLVNSER
jgi:glycosyltransferase involved in cell wall biosynthesis